MGQRDELWPTLTPREQLSHAAELFRRAGADVEEDRVADVLDRLGLASCAETIVGHHMVPGGLSGGQRRRLSIGIALLKRPICAFLDEPTSGLDQGGKRVMLSHLSRRFSRNSHVEATWKPPVPTQAWTRRRRFTR